MRIRRLLPIVLAIGTATALAPAAMASPHPSAAAPATKVVVVRPVTSGGRPAAGFRIVRTTRHSEVYCGDSSSSPGAVDPDIDFCSPSAAYTIACWKAPAKNTI